MEVRRFPLCSFFFSHLCSRNNFFTKHFLQICFVDLIEGMEWRPAGRTGISPPAPLENEPTHDLPPGYNPLGITNKKTKDRHV